MNQTYVGCSMYHVYISILLAYKNKRENVKSLLIIIEDRTEGITSYIEPLKKLNIFVDVVGVKGYTPVREMKKKANKIGYIFNRSNLLKTIFESLNPGISKYHDFLLNSEINLYHIVNSRAYFLIKYPNNNFRMIEEGTGTYKHKMPLSRKLKRTLMNYPLLMGYDPQVKEVLVQEPEKIIDDLLREKGVKLEFQKLQDDLSPSDKKDIIECFKMLELDVYNSNKKAIILTQPLIETGAKVTKEEMIAVYREMINSAKGKGLEVYLKMHPREEIDYDKVFEEENIKVLPKLIPIEVLNLDDKISFDEAHTISSGSIGNLRHVKYRNTLGFDNINK